MKKKPEETKKDFGRDIAAYEKLPEKTKKLLNIKEGVERTTGSKNVALTKKAREISKSR